MKIQNSITKIVKETLVNSSLINSSLVQHADLENIIICVNDE